MFVFLSTNSNKFLQKYILFSMYKNFIFGYPIKFWIRDFSSKR